MDTTNTAANATTNSYLNYALWALGVLCALGVVVAILVSR